MSDEEGSLTKSIMQIVKGNHALEAQPNIYQILEVNAIPQTNTGQNRTKVVVSDGAYKIDALPSSSFDSWFQQKEIIAGTIIEATKLTVNNINGKRVMILIEFNVLQKECEILENPQDLPSQFRGGNAGSRPASNAFGSRPSAFGSNQNNAFGGNRTMNTNTFGGGGTSMGGASSYQALSELSPFQKSFTIKVRVTRKGNIRSWSNSRGTGRLFSVDILDHQGNEMQCTVFTDAVDKIYPQLEEGKVFIIKKGKIKVANKRYTHIKAEYSLEFTNDTEITPAGDDSAIAGMQYEFQPLSAMAELPDKSYVDCTGIVDVVGEVQNFTSKSGKELTKRTFRVVDETNEAIECTLWGDEANKFQESYLNQPIAIKAARVSDYNGKSLSVNKYHVNAPNEPRTEQLKKWWAVSGSTTSFHSLTQSRGSGGGRNEPPITLREARAKGYGQTEEPQYFNVKITVQYIPHNIEKKPWYTAVPRDAKSEDGRDLPGYKVVQNDGESGYYCEKNGKTYGSCSYRYILRFRGLDFSGEQWFNAYDDSAQIIMGVTADEINQAGDDEATFSAFFDKPIMKMWNLRVRAKTETWNEEPRARFDIMGATPIDAVSDAKEMIRSIDNLLNETGA